MNTYEQWLAAMEAAGIAPLRFDTCCKILAICYYMAIEDFIFNPKLKADCEYAARRFHFQGGETPDADAVERINELVADLEAAPEDKNSNTPWAVIWPQWAIDIMAERYNVKLPNHRIG